MTFFKTVKAISKKHGISQSDFAIALNIPLSTVNDWWHGRYFLSSLPRAKKIARFLKARTGKDITIDSLMRGTRCKQ